MYYLNRKNIKCEMNGIFWKQNRDFAACHKNAVNVLLAQINGMTSIGVF
jgi:hypothetical protein